MAQITVKYDPQLDLPEIEDLMYSTSKEESPEDRPSDVDQTKFVGIVTPLIRLNKMVIMWAQIKTFELTCTGIVPTLRFTFTDDLGFTKSLDQPKPDNELQIQILPPFDDAYKKINLLFYITNININGSLVTISAKYKVSDLYQYHIESFGKINTYDLFDTIAKNTQLGLASNIDGVDDERYVYCNNHNYLETLEDQIQMSGTQDNILDCWVDWHNYLVLCDMRERYTTKDQNIKIWTTTTPVIDTQTDTEVVPVEVDAIITNANAMMNTQLYISDYTVKTKSFSNFVSGTDKVLESYIINNGEATSILVQDGDVHKDTFIKTVYMGEVFGDFDYFAQSTCRYAFLQKMNTNCIEVELKQPVLGLERGSQVHVEWYDVNEMVSVVKEENPIENNEPSQEGEPDDIEYLTLNKQVSGQYLIIGTTLQYNGLNNGWKYKLLLTRPLDEIKSYVEDE